MSFDVGARVRLINSPDRVGFTTGHLVAGPRGDMIEVDFGPHGCVLHLRQTLEMAPLHVSPRHDFAQGRFSGPRDLSAVITLEKLRGELTDLVYSMGSGNVTFFPHQFKPVLKFVQANVGRILIADEVGLGKTIEAIYLWKELQTRDHARRLLVVCPSMLKEKWRRELDHAFGIEARIAEAKDLVDALKRAQRNAASGFALIIGLESCRPPRDYETGQSARAQLARLLEESPAGDDDGLIDLTIIDEAHYLRNPETRASKLGHLLRDASRRMALLTATPIQLHAGNLYQLLRLVDPEEYESEFVFNMRRAANAPIVAAASVFRRHTLAMVEAAAAIDACLEERLFGADPWLISLRERIADGGLDRAEQIEAARQLEERSLLGRHMTRSRKRDVLDTKVERSAQNMKIRFTPVEAAAYRSAMAELSSRSAGGWTGAITGATLGLITRQRQMASCLPAALAAWRDSGVIDDELWEDIGRSDDGDIESISLDAMDAPAGLDLARLEREDSKYLKFLEAVRQELARNPQGKIVVFAYFRATLDYLGRRLAADGVSAVVLMGGMKDQQLVLDEFASPRGASVLLSSEVASEGVDLQFARVIVNYDLPWNPMRVEQRIGRLDRLGQTAEKISIINLFVQDTIEERILERLYERIGVFKESIGDLEIILGEISDELLTSVMDPTLSDDQREARAQQTLNALEERVQANRQLEEEAQHLLGLTDVLSQEVAAKHEAGEWIRPAEIRTFLSDSLARRFPASKLNLEPDEDFFRLDLCADAKLDLGSFLDSQEPDAKSRGLLDPRTVYLSDPSKMSRGRGTVEVVHPGHPLLRWLRAATDASGRRPHAVCAAWADAADCNVPPGLYAYAVHLRSLKGLRREVVLETAAQRVGSDELLFGAEAAAVRKAAETGRAFPPTDAEIEACVPLATSADERLTIRAEERAASFEIENERLCEQRAEAARAFRDRRVDDIKATLEKVEHHPDQRRIKPALEGRWRKEEDHLQAKLSRIDAARRVDAGERLVALGVLLVE
ncbi:MAG TPA: SNF2-related protein [Caulobacteraceae bacterium]|nr:SNF2-related protein [Caulobacteraceae bacterium]